MPETQPPRFSELLTASRFYLELSLTGGNDTADATFLECRGFKRSQDVAEICEVAPQQWAKAKSGRVIRTKVPGNTKTENIVLRRGMTNSMTLWNWFAQVEAGKWGEQLRDGSLVIYDQAGQEQARFNFQKAWPVRYTAADVSAKSTDIEIEELEIAVETFVRVQ
ncbi:MAG: phage tail protein [Leptolyngbyaceae cyanobacterium SM1_3_5]|nr:phage tail protein [Leptolyngbyaceae cyanobacterium SM1_3_5]